ncbi:MAG: hypothetical protein AB1668_02095 [Nanoarchaeota archaeon]
MATKEELKAKFLKVYGNLPVPERSQFVAIVNDEPYSWNVAYTEVERDTKLGLKILKKMELLGIL